MLGAISLSLTDAIYLDYLMLGELFMVIIWGKIEK